MNIPKSYQELQKLPRAKLVALWTQIFHNSPHGAVNLLHRPLWYRIQCDYLKTHLKPKYITRLNKYSKNPDECINRARTLKYELKPGSIITKTYKGQTFTLRIIANDRFEYDGKTFNSLSAAAQAMCGLKVSGTDFFGLNNKTCPAFDMT